MKVRFLSTSTRAPMRPLATKPSRSRRAAVIVRAHGCELLADDECRVRIRVQERERVSDARDRERVAACLAALATAGIRTDGWQR